MIRTAPPLPPKEFATPNEARAHLALVLDDWATRPAAERFDEDRIAGRTRNAADTIATWEGYREQYGDLPTQWSRDVVKSLAELEERVYATAPLPRPEDRPHAPGSFEPGKWSRIAEWKRLHEREREYLEERNRRR